MVTISSSKVTITVSFSLKLYLLTPFTFFRIEPILFEAPHAPQPGIVSCTIRSSANTAAEKISTKTAVKTIVNIFSIGHLLEFNNNANIVHMQT
jgi:hypothetical protein